MSFRYRSHARRRALVAALVGVAAVAALGPAVAVPAVALVALVYYGHQVAATFAGDPDVPYPSLALVISVNALIVLLVQLLLVVQGLDVV